MKIAIITNESFPSGMATTNRIHSLAKGLILYGDFVEVLCVRPTEEKENPLNFNKVGETEEIKFFYTTRTIFWPSSKVQKAIESIIGVFLLLKKLKKENYDIIISTTSNITSNYFYKSLAKIKGIPIILAIDEYPHVVRTPKKYPKLFTKFYLKTFYRFFDGLIVMTKVLIDYYKSLTNPQTRYIHIPMTVDLNRFEGEKQIPAELKGEKYVVYCGNLGQNKDGVPILIKAFYELLKENNEYKLVIIGSIANHEKKKLSELYNLVSKLRIENQVVFTGQISKERIPGYLCNASALALARPNNLQAQGGFPTKLGEYLATGKPVVVTKVGEIPDYLNNENAFLAEPDSIESFKNAMQNALLNKNALKIGQHGKEVAHKNFSYVIQGKRLSQFLKSFVNE